MSADTSSTAPSSSERMHYNTGSSVYAEEEYKVDGQIEPMRDDPPITGQKWCCMSIVGPEGTRQKSKVHAFKVRYVCEEEAEAKSMAKYLRDRDPNVDVYVGPVGKWLPLIFSALDIADRQYMHSQLSELMAQQQRQREVADTDFDQRVRRDLEEIRKMNTKEGQAAAQSEKEKVQSVYFKMMQLSKVIAERQRELDALTALFEGDQYTAEERESARNHEYPEVRIAPSSFQHIKEDSDGAVERTGPGSDIEGVIRPTEQRTIDVSSTTPTAPESTGTGGAIKRKGYRRLFKRGN